MPTARPRSPHLGPLAPSGIRHRPRGEGRAAARSKRDPAAHTRQAMLAAQGRLDDVDVDVDVMAILDVSGIPSQHAARRRGRRDDLIGLPTTWVLPASPRGPHEVRHARRPHTLQEETPRPAPRRRPQQARHDRTMGCPQWGAKAARGALRSERWGTFIVDLQMLVELSKRERPHSSVAAGCCSKPSAPRASRGSPRSSKRRSCEQRFRPPKPTIRPNSCG